MEGENEDEGKKNLQGTAINLPLNHNGNLKSALSDQNLSDILLNIRSSKTPAVINYGASWYVNGFLTPPLYVSPI